MGGAAEPQAQSKPQPPPLPLDDLNVVQEQKVVKIKQKVVHRVEKQVKSSSRKGNISFKGQISSEGNAIPKLNPKCLNNKASSYVCLSKSCKEYPFYCLDCESECEDCHHHQNKSVSVSLKEFQRRIQNRLTPDPTFLETVKCYRLALQQMQQSFGNFYAEEMGMIRSIEQMKQLPPENKRVKIKIEKNDKVGLDGRQMGELWQDSAGWKDQQEKLIKFLKEKQELLLNLIECFTQINQHTQDKHPSPSPSPSLPTSPQHSSCKPIEEKALHLYRRFQLQRNLALSKEGAWSSSKKTA